MSARRETSPHATHALILYSFVRSGEDSFIVQVIIGLVVVFLCGFVCLMLGQRRLGANRKSKLLYEVSANIREECGNVCNIMGYCI